MKFFSNKEIAKLLRNISAAYTAKNGPYFKIVAYDNAADSIEHSTSEIKDLWEDKKLDTVVGLGKGIQEYLDELFKTGKVKHFDEVQKGLPKGMFELLGITGIGPKTAYKLAKELKIRNISDLEKVAKEGKIRKLEGFGEKSEKEILISIEQHKGKLDRLLLPFAFATSEKILNYLRKNKDVEKAEPLGSLRRRVATVGDIDIAVASENTQKVIDYFKRFSDVQRVLGAGPMSSSVVLKNGIQVDLKVLPTDSFGSLLQHFTGSKSHNVSLREFALKEKMSLSEHGIKHKGKLIKFGVEEDFYKYLGLRWIEPELRENTGEIEASLNNQLPKLVEGKDIRGDIHIHSNFPIEPSHDLGKHSLENMVKKAKDLGYEYIGLSDHSPGYSTHTKKQIIELIKRRTNEIEQIKGSDRSIRILNLLEIDVLADGKLSVPNAGLMLLDGAIAGIHSSHNQEKKRITGRLLSAINCEFVKIISHPTGRLLQQRESYEADWPKVFEACRKTQTLLEINAWPSRLDLPDTLVRDAIKCGVKLVINTDAHALEHMDNMKFGVSVARRGWAEKKHIANTQNWLEFKKMFRYH